MEPRDFRFYRDEFFINPKTAPKQQHLDAASFLIRNLTGLPPEEPSSPIATNSPIGEFATRLNTIMQDSRRFDHRSVAQLHPSNNWPAILAHISSTMRNNNTIIGDVSPVETGMEKEAMDWIIKNIARFNPENTSVKIASGALDSGGTISNIAGLMVARDKLVRSGWKGTTPVHVLTTPMAHYSISQAAATLAPNNLIQVHEVPVMEDTYKMDTRALELITKTMRKLDHKVMAIVAVAGETETGAVDDLDTIAAIAEQEKIHLHIDGAYGAPYTLSKREALFKGMERADSLTVDPHKYLYTPYSAGAIIFRSSEDHALIGVSKEKGDAYLYKTDEAHVKAHKFKKEDSTHLGKKRIEGSMGGQAAAALWAVINTLGIEGIKFILDHTIDVTEATYKTVVASPILAPAHLPDINSLCFYPQEQSRASLLADPNAYARIVEGTTAMLEHETGAYVATTELPIPDGTKNPAPKKVFRFVATNPYTEPEDAIQIIHELEERYDRVAQHEQALVKRK